MRPKRIHTHSLTVSLYEKVFLLSEIWEHVVSMNQGSSVMCLARNWKTDVLFLHSRGSYCLTCFSYRFWSPRILLYKVYQAVYCGVMWRSLALTPTIYLNVVVLTHKEDFLLCTCYFSYKMWDTNNEVFHSWSASYINWNFNLWKIIIYVVFICCLRAVEPTDFPCKDGTFTEMILSR